MRLREIRERKGLSQVQLEKLSGVHRVCISRYEHGTKKPGVDSLKRLAVALGVTVDELIGGD